LSYAENWQQKPAGGVFPSKHHATMKMSGEPRLKDRQVAREMHYLDAPQWPSK